MVKVFAVSFFMIIFFFFGNAFEIEPRIVRGYTARAGQFPYYALLKTQSTEKSIFGIFGRCVRTSTCGATLISDQWLVTAAHCLDARDKLMMHLGISQIHEAKQHKAIKVGPENVYYPSMYNKTHQRIDIALIRLPERVQFSEFIKPVRLPTTCETPLVSEADGTLIGVSSFVSSTDFEKGTPQGFVNVFAFLHWIKNVTGIDLPDCS